MEPLKLSVTETAAKLDISRKTLSALLNQRAGISPAMAIRLAAAPKAGCGNKRNTILPRLKPDMARYCGGGYGEYQERPPVTASVPYHRFNSPRPLTAPRR